MPKQSGNKVAELAAAVREFASTISTVGARPFAPGSMDIFIPDDASADAINAAKDRLAKALQDTPKTGDPLLRAGQSAVQRILCSCPGTYQANEIIRTCIVDALESASRIFDMASPVEKQKRRRGETEAQNRIRRYINKQRKEDPGRRITAREIADAVDCSTSTVSSAPAWKSYQETRQTNQPNRRPQTAQRSEHCTDSGAYDPAKRAEDRETLKKLLGEQEDSLVRTPVFVKRSRFVRNRVLRINDLRRQNQLRL